MNGTLFRSFVLLALALLFFTAGCTQEKQNQMGRSLRNWTGTNGVLDVYAGEKLIMRLINVDKLSTAMGTEDNTPRPYRFGYGYVDENLNYKVDEGEKRIYFEVSDYSTNYVFYENYRG